VPNSVRVSSETGKNCIEFAPLISAGRYSPGIASGAVTLFSPAGWTELTSYSQPLFMTVYPVDASTDIYQQGRVASLLNLSATGNELSVTASFATTPRDSPSARMYFFGLPVAYCQEGAELYRYQRTGLDQPLSGRTLMAEALDTEFYVAEPPFQYQDSLVLTRNSVVHIRLAFKSLFADRLVFNQEIHIPNVP